MANIEIAATTGRQVVINADVIKQFRTGLRGGHLLRDDDGYDAARKIYNAMIEHRPAIIARCAGAADVISAVNFARNNGLLVSVRGGGHNVSGNAVCDGGLMIDLSPMKSVRVDPQGKTVRAEAGVIWGEFDRETQAFGLATTGGLVSTTGIAGLSWVAASAGLWGNTALPATT
jgi:FAD/FMN-containing dehydrogenase